MTGHFRRFPLALALALAAVAAVAVAVGAVAGPDGALSVGDGTGGAIYRLAPPR